MPKAESQRTHVTASKRKSRMLPNDAVSSESSSSSQRPQTISSSIELPLLAEGAMPYPPPRGLKYNAYVFDQYREYGPLKELHPALVPSSRQKRDRDRSHLYLRDRFGKKMRLHPPTFYYGYLVKNDFIKPYADEYNLNVFDVSTDCTGKRIVETEWDDTATVDKVLAHICKKLNLKRKQLRTELSLLGPPGDGRMISLASNYDMDGRMPSAEIIELIRQILGEDEAPQWYIDGEWKTRWHL